MKYCHDLLLKDEYLELGRREKFLTFPVASSDRTGSTSLMSDALYKDALGLIR